LQSETGGALQKPGEILKSVFGFDSFRGKQQDIISRLVEERLPALVLMPTGGGKSLCYQIPALCFEGGTLVISPLIALMQDQADALRKRGVAASYINSTVSREDREKRVQQFIDGKLKLLYVTPERFRKPEFARAIRTARIDLLAIDEAHCISEWGHDFRPDYSRIGEFRALIGNPLTLALTATATPEVQRDILIKLNLDPESTRIFSDGIRRENLKLEVAEVWDEKSRQDLVLSAMKNYPGTGIIYFSLISTLEKFSHLLQTRGIPHLIYHGKLTDQHRKRVLRDFITGSDSLMLATNAFGMGIDKPDIRFVIHAEIPGSPESYYQETGRAGRDGNPALCLLIYQQEDLETQHEFLRWANPDAGFYYRLYSLLAVSSLEVNAIGIDFLREQLHYKSKKDFRIETALGILDRFGVTAGSLEKRNLEIVADLPDELDDETYLEKKLAMDRKKLYAILSYVREEGCRRQFLESWFGYPDGKPCGQCDTCKSGSAG